MFRTYLSVVALVCLAAVAGCGDDETAGTGGTGGVGGGMGGMGGDTGTGGTGGGIPGAESKVITIGCGNNVTDDVSILEWTLEVAPQGDVTAGASFDALLGGEAEFAEAFLDAAQGAVPLGLRKAGLVDIKATVQVRGDGATGDDVELTAGSDIPYECWLSDDGDGAQEECDPANNLPSTPGFTGNSDCAIQVNQNPCVRVVTIPTSDDCDAGGECETLGKESQCTANGFCVTGGLPIPLDTGMGSYTAGDGTNDALFGWFDTPPTDSPSVDDPPIDEDGTYNIIRAMYTGVAGPVGLAVYAGLTVQVECLMAEDSGGANGVSACTGGDNDGVQCDPANDNPDGSNTDCTPVDAANTCDAVTDDASPTPDSALLAIPVN